METLPHEAQLALTSFLAALAVGGPVAVMGTDKAVSLAGLVARFVIRRRLLTSLGIGLVGGAGMIGSGLMGQGGARVAGLVSGFLV